MLALRDVGLLPGAREAPVPTPLSTDPINSGPVCGGSLGKPLGMRGPANGGTAGPRMRWLDRSHR